MLAAVEGIVGGVVGLGAGGGEYGWRHGGGEAAQAGLFKLLQGEGIGPAGKVFTV